MKSKNSIIFNIVFIVLLLLIILFAKKLLPIKSEFIREILNYFIWLLLIFVAIQFFNKGKFKYFGFIKKNEVPKGITRNARLIGLILGVLSNIIFLYLFDVDDYLKNFNLLQKIILTILLAPIVEEIVFRGYIQTIIGFAFEKFKKSNKIFWLPIIITSIIFSLLHFTAIKTVNIYQTLFTVALALVAGLFAGYFKEKSNSLIPSINLHMFSNMGSFFAILIMLVISPGIAHKKLVRSYKPTYQFDMNDSTKFMNSLINFSVYERNLPDSLRGKFQNVKVATLLTIDFTGKIVDIQLDSIKNEQRNIKSEYYKSAALEVANKLPDFVPPKDLKGDTTILFYVSF
ncbi:MAG: JDVT-CTERM system glutamic-type intramembrane protease [Bacteroidales bacterium]|jgi:membrane protease YdiL (CAAX protease family)|nr:CPBP family glutamic-type intramembrane protease [Bacteroidales bacterium]MDD3700711.1 CPBP family glutamic-type intramembrane protease [Bacteroidales bacterium]MDY0370603.1 JDVT-CTERM system glutamic-type intramembrane protease [Bacteroidales bacterium]